MTKFKTQPQRDIRSSKHIIKLRYKRLSTRKL